MKHLHRLIVTSEAYQRTTAAGDAHDNVAIDSDNQWLWRMNSGRMEAEVIRDSLLFCGGMLELDMGGQPLENEKALTTYRRSLYYEVYPEEGGASQLAVLFDAPNPLDCYRRTRSIVPQQALVLTNSQLIHQVSRKMVTGWQARVKPGNPKSSDTGSSDTGSSDTGSSDEKSCNTERFVSEMFERILSRVPTAEERRVCADAIATQLEILSAAGDPDPHTGARESLVRALLNHNDFVTIR